MAPGSLPRRNCSPGACRSPAEGRHAAQHGMKVRWRVPDELVVIQHQLARTAPADVWDHGDCAPPPQAGARPAAALPICSNRSWMSIRPLRVSRIICWNCSKSGAGGGAYRTLRGVCMGEPPAVCIIPSILSAALPDSGPRDTPRPWLAHKEIKVLGQAVKPSEYCCSLARGSLQPVAGNTPLPSGEKASSTRCGGRSSVSATSVRSRRCQPIALARFDERITNIHRQHHAKTLFGNMLCGTGCSGGVIEVVVVYRACSRCEVARGTPSAKKRADY